MESLTGLLQSGAGHAWLFFPTAILLGALHGLEPGHSKTMMAAFIIAVRGTVAQAVLLGLSAAASHSVLIWVIAAAGLFYGTRVDVADSAYFQLVSAVIIAGMALWMIWKTRRDQRAAHHHAHHSHGHHDHGHHDHEHDHGHQGHEHHHHGHGEEVHQSTEVEFQDAHERAHALEIEQRFAGGKATTGQILLFGLTGGLMPCPAAVSILFVCLQVRQFVLGFALVLAFSLGLALTLVATGALAAWSVRHAEKRFAGFGEWMRKAPYISGGLLLLVAAFLAIQATMAILHPVIGDGVSR